MSAESRLFTADISALTLYKNKPDYSDLNITDQLLNMIAIFKGCRIRASTSTNPGRAILERGRHPIPYELGYLIEVGAVLDPTYPNLLKIFLLGGAGPYWFWAWLSPNSEEQGYQQLSFMGRCIISDVAIVSGGEDSTQDMGLEVQGDLLNVGLGSLPE